MEHILITGASSGIGAALAELYAQPNHTLYIIARRQDRLEQIAASCRSKGAVVHSFVTDVRDRESMAAIIKKIEETAPLSLVIANAGISGGTGGLSADRLYEQEQMIFDINLSGVLNTIHPVIPYMIDRKCGQIAIISSLASFLPLPGAPAYSASKAAIRFYGEALTQNLHPYGVSISMVCPGFIKSEITDANEFHMPFLMETQTAAQAIADGLSRRKAFITFPLFTSLSTRFLSLLPRFIQNCIFTRLPKKNTCLESKKLSG